MFCWTVSMWKPSSQKTTQKASEAQAITNDAMSLTTLMLNSPEPVSKITEISGCLQFLAHSVEDANNPKHCTTCLFGCALSVTPSAIASIVPQKFTPAEEALLDPLRAQFCKAVTSFLTVPRTSRDLSALMARLSECNCGDASAPLVMRLHERGREVLTEEWSHRAPNSVLIIYLFSLLSVRLHEAGPVRVAKGQGKCWPASVEEIMPFGAPAFVTAVGQWMIILDEPVHPLEVVTKALPLCGRPLFIALTASPVFMRQLIFSMKAINRHIKDSTRGRRMDRHNPWVRFRDFLHAVMSTRTSQSSIMVWTRGHETQLWEIFSTATRLLRSPEANLTPVLEDYYDDMDEIVKTFRDLILQFSTDAVEPARIHPELVIDRNAISFIPPPTTEVGLTDLVLFIADLKSWRYCFVVGCPWSFQEIGSTFRKCAACSVPGYCSSECQALDWKDPQYPHRTFCAKINEFIGAGGGRLTEKRKFITKFNYRAFRGDSTLRDIQAWARASRAKVEAWDLQRAENAMLISAGPSQA